MNTTLLLLESADSAEILEHELLEFFISKVVASDR